VVGVARLYRDFASTLVVDSADGELVDAVEAEGMRCLVTPTVMTDVGVATDLCRTLLSLDRPAESSARQPR
jgi:LPPG:FO 2-phospho-L-lactate transferase